LINERVALIHTARDALWVRGHWTVLHDVQLTELVERTVRSALKNRLNQTPPITLFGLYLRTNTSLSRRLSMNEIIIAASPY